MKTEKMVRMANQIAAFFKSQRSGDQVRNVARHINDFWEPRMRIKLAEYIAEGGGGLDPLVLQARDYLRLPRD